MEAPRNNGVPRAVRMQRSSSQLGSNTAKESQQHHHHQYYPWMAIKLDRSNISLMESECGSTSTVMTNTNYGRHVDVSPERLLVSQENMNFEISTYIS